MDVFNVLHSLPPFPSLLHLFYSLCSSSADRAITKQGAEGGIAGRRGYLVKEETSSYSNLPLYSVKLGLIELVCGDF